MPLQLSPHLLYDPGMTSSILRIAIPSPLYQCFDYLAPDQTKLAELQPGIRVKVSFGRREVVGILMEVATESTFDRAKLKQAIEILDSAPILSPSLLKLMSWAARYYQHPLGDVILGSLPKLIREGRALSVATQVLLEKTIEENLIANPAQQAAIDAITQSHNFTCIALDGVTGSGKTEVYLQAIAEIIKEGRQALVLVPEIGLTPQSVARFERRFSVPVLSYHSGLTEKQRFTVWSAAYQDESCIIIGTRSALFLPLKKLGLIILDEEHDLSFKQQTGFRYSARDCAVMRAQFENIPIVLGTATLSLESFYNVQRKRYQHHVLPERAGTASPPSLNLINLCQQNLTAGLSPILLKAIQKHLDQKGQVLLFLNRRGFAPVWLCHHCGWMAHCDRCDAKLTLHQNPQRLRCHHCDATRPLPKKCKECQSTELMHVGQGTEQLEETITRLFPNEKVLRIDRDTTRTKGRLHAMLDEIHSGDARILIGTQMLAKGHHFKDLTMVAMVDADGGLFSTDFRAIERLGQLIVQVSGRAGREEQPGEVYIQTHHPEHPLLQLLLTSGYHAFMRALLIEREQAALPPFSHYALLRAEASDRDKPLAFLEKAKHDLKAKSFHVLGPIPAPLERKAGHFRAHLLLQSTHRSVLQNELEKLVQKLNTHKTSRQVRWSIDVDPQEGF